MKNLKQITSFTNENIKFLKKLFFKKYRVRYKKFVIENFKTINDAYSQKILFEKLFVTKEFFELNKSIIDLWLSTTTSEIFIIPETIAKNISQLASYSPILAIYNDIESKINENEDLIYLNNINDPGNLGTILRTAAAFNFKNIIVDEHTCDIYNPKVISAAKNSLFLLNIEHDNNLVLFNKYNQTHETIVTKIKGNLLLNDYERKNQKICLVFGNEANGIAKNIIELAKNSLTIPISNKIESLNVAISMGIICHKLNKK